MSMHNKKTARLLQGVALGLIIIATILFAGCENPVGGAENNPLADFVGKVYKAVYEGGYTETFSISQDNTGNIFLTINDITGKIIESKTADTGTVYLLECSNHSNYSPSQYPNFTEENPHTGCYLPLYVLSITSTTVEWATFWTSVDTKKTACFDSNSDYLPKAKEYLDFSKWDEPYSYSTGIAQN